MSSSLLNSQQRQQQNQKINAGSEVVVKVIDTWIHARVISFDRNTYKVKHADSTSPNNGTITYQAIPSHVIPLVVPAKAETFEQGTRVLALFPWTTKFRAGTVISKEKGDKYGVRFDNDREERRIVKKRKIPRYFVVRDPLVISHEQKQQCKRHLGKVAEHFRLELSQLCSDMGVVSPVFHSPGMVYVLPLDLYELEESKAKRLVDFVEKKMRVLWDRRCQGLPNSAAAACAAAAFAADVDPAPAAAAAVLSSDKKRKKTDEMNDRAKNIQLHMTLLVHASACRNNKCPSANCAKMKALLTHGTF